MPVSNSKIGKIMCSLLFFIIYFLFPPLSNAQENYAITDEASYVGMTLEELIIRFGIPRSVHAVRGIVEWQDDVVFVYDAADFYIYRNRVWQVGLTSYMGVNTGDFGQIVPLIMDTAPGFSMLDSPPNFTAYYMYEQSWPMILRFDLNDAGRVRGIFIFRSDL